MYYLSCIFELDKGWGLWNPWTPCSVTCGGTGTRTRQRVCSSPPECRSACIGPEEEKESCEASNRCPGEVGSIFSSKTIPGLLQCSDKLTKRERSRKPNPDIYINGLQSWSSGFTVLRDFTATQPGEPGLVAMDPKCLCNKDLFYLLS